jgi:DNA-binding Xre family transcriptional regulator
MNYYTTSIKMYSVEKGITLGDVCVKTGASRQNMSNILRTGNPTLKTLSKISKALNVKPSDIILRAEELEKKEGEKAYALMKG